MSGLAGGVGPALSNAEFQAQVQVSVLKKQQDVAEELGDLAVSLIQSASVDPHVGQNVNIQV